jgi:hypothetical protein
MKKLIFSAILIAISAATAFADAQWDVDAADLEFVECWDAETCTAVAGSARLFDPTNPSDSMWVDVTQIFDDGWFHFYVGADDVVGCDTNPGLVYISNQVTMDFEGPGFFYQVNVTLSAPMMYQCGLPGFPTLVSVPAGDGCDLTGPGLEWTWDVYPDGEVSIAAPFTVEDGETLVIDPGMSIFAVGGVDVTILGDVQANGTMEDWIHFAGSDWKGLTVGDGGTGTISYASFTGVVDDSDGGAILVDAGGDLDLNNCLIAQNSTTAMGGGIFVAIDGSVTLTSCTVADNSAPMGANVYLDSNIEDMEYSVMDGYYNLIAFGDSYSYFGGLEVTPFNGLQYSCVYPLENPEVSTGWYCDPGFVDAENFDYNISFWNVDDETIINCIIDVAISATHLDPDGTLKDMGALPFNQYEVIQPGHIMTVEDVAGDQGGSVMLTFAASPNDGGVINPISTYTVWTWYPGSEDPVTGISFSALADPAAVYQVIVPTLDDQYGEVDNIHAFVISAHSVYLPSMVAMSNAMEGFSLDNIAPVAVTGVEMPEDWDVDWDDPVDAVVEFSWNVNTANDFAYFEVYSVLNEDIATRELVYTGVDTQYMHVVDIAGIEDNDYYRYEFFAFDEHQNISDSIEVPGPVYISTDLIEVASFELGQNYPNPFNPTTAIDFAVEYRTDVNLSVYNIAGEKVAELVNSEFAAGSHSVVFDASVLPSGVYIYQIQAGTFADQHKMILVK